MLSSELPERFSTNDTGKKRATLTCGFPNLSAIEDKSSNSLLKNYSKPALDIPKLPDDLLNCTDGFLFPENPTLTPATPESATLKRGKSCEKIHKFNYLIVDRKGVNRALDLVFTGNTEEVATFLRDDHIKFSSVMNGEGRIHLKVRILICAEDLPKESNSFSGKIYGHLLKKSIEHGKIFQMKSTKMFYKNKKLT